jgi:hypothetical protein
VERTTPALRQYNFEDCPDAKLASCCQYEYLASSKLVRETVKRWREGQHNPLTKAVALLFGPDIFSALKGSWWPERPYLDSPLAEDRHPPLQKRQPRDLTELVRPWTYLLDPKEAERVVPVYLNPYLPLPQLKKAIAELLQRDYPHLLTKAAKPQWSRALADLLRRKDPLFKELVESEPLSRKRGRGSRIEQYRADLKALSAWRLSRQFGYSAKEAIKLMHDHRLSTYQSKRAFYGAVSRAARKITALEEQLRQFAENMTA